MKVSRLYLLVGVLALSCMKQDVDVCLSCPTQPPPPPPPPQPPPPPPPPPTPASLSVSPKSATCLVRNTVQLSAAVTVPAGMNNRVAWGTTSLTTATVDTLGLVRCVAPGLAKIWVKIVASPSTSDTASVTVNAPPPPMPVTISFAPKDTSVFRTQSYTLRRTITAPSGQPTTSTCVSRDTRIATVDVNTCVVTAVWPGTGNIAGVTWVVGTATADQSKRDSALVRIPLSRVTNLTVLPDSVVLRVGQERDFLVNIEGDPGVSTNFTCFSSNGLYVTATATGVYCRVKGIFSNSPSNTPVTVRTIGLDANNQPVTKGVRVFVIP